MENFIFVQWGGLTLAGKLSIIYVGFIPVRSIPLSLHISQFSVLTNIFFDSFWQFVDKNIGKLCFDFLYHKYVKKVDIRDKTWLASQKIVIKIWQTH